MYNSCHFGCITYNVNATKMAPFVTDDPVTLFVQMLITKKGMSITVCISIY